MGTMSHTPDDQRDESPRRDVVLPPRAQLFDAAPPANVQPRPALLELAKSDRARTRFHSGPAQLHATKGVPRATEWFGFRSFWGHFRRFAAAAWYAQAAEAAPERLDYRVKAELAASRAATPERHQPLSTQS